MKKTIIILIAFLVILTGCGQDQQTIKIGVVSVQTGPIAPISVPSIHAIQLATEDWNAQNEQQFQIIFEDTAGQGATAATAFNKLVNVDEVTGIIGDITSTTMAIGPIADDMQVPVISYLTTSPTATDAGDFVFRTSPMNLEGMNMIAEYLVKTNRTRISILVENNDYPVSLKEAFVERLHEINGQIVQEQLFDRTQDLRTILMKAQQNEPQAIMLFVISPSTAVNVLKQAKELQIELPIFGSETAASDMALKAGGQELFEGFITSAPRYNPETVAELKQRYIQKVGNDDILDWLYVATGYDAAMIFFNTINDVGTDPVTIKEALYNLENYDGVSGKISFDENGDPIGTEFILFQIKDGQKEIIN